MDLVGQLLKKQSIRQSVSWLVLEESTTTVYVSTCRLRSLSFGDQVIFDN